jgi:hypothetical protein
MLNLLNLAPSPFLTRLGQVNLDLSRQFAKFQWPNDKTWLLRNWTDISDSLPLTVCTKIVQNHRVSKNLTDEAGLSWVVATRMRMTTLRLVHSRMVF